MEEGGEGLGEEASLVAEQVRCVNGPPGSLCYTGSHSQDNSHGTALFH